MKKKTTYLNEWKETGEKNAFVELLLHKFPHITKKTAVRRYYDVRSWENVDPAASRGSLVSPPPSLLFQDEEAIPVDRIKLLMIEDMKRYKLHLTPNLLRQYGFSNGQIAWLVQNKKITLEA